MERGKETRKVEDNGTEKEEGGKHREERDRDSDFITA